LARWVEAFGAAMTPGALGNRYLIRKRSRRSERSRWRLRTRRLFMWDGRGGHALGHFLREWDVQVADGGKTWAHIGLEDSRQIARILIDPKDPEKLFVAALGHAYGPNAERGVFYSKDGGKKWKHVLFHDENTGAIDLAFEPGNPKTIFCGAAADATTRRGIFIHRRRGRGQDFIVRRMAESIGRQVERARIGGRRLGRMGIAFAPSNPRRIYLIADAKEGGLYRSDDGGENWQHVSADKRIWGRGWYFCEVSVDPKDADTVYVPNTGCIVRATAGRHSRCLRRAGRR